MRVRTEKIFNKLLFSQYPIPIERLADENKVSIRSIRNDLAEINSFLSEYSYNQVENIRNRGLWLDISKNGIKEITNLLTLEHENIYLDKKIRQFNLILEVSIGSFFFIYEKEEEFSVSKSTLDSDMRDLRKLFRKYNIELTSNPKEDLELIGSERTIRTMIFEQIFENLGTMDIMDRTKYHLPEFQVFFKFVSLETFYKINDIYNEFFLDYQDYIYKEQAIIFLKIWIRRNKSNNKLNNKDENYTIDYENKIYQFISKIITEFKIDTSKKEIYYIYSMLDTLLNKNQNDPVNWVDAQVFTVNLINHVEQELKISFNQESELFYERLLEHNLSLLPRVKNNMQIFNPLTDNIRENYSSLFNIIQDFSEEKLELNGNKIKDDEIAFLTIHFLTAVSRKEQSEPSTYRTAVFCNYGLATGTLLAENLKQYYPIDVVAVLSMNELYLLDKLDIDIVFSTSPIEIEEYPFLVIDPIMNNKNKKNIDRFLDENSHRKQTVKSKHYNKTDDIIAEIIEIIESTYKEISSKTIEEIISAFSNNGLMVNTEEIQPMIKDILEDDNILLNLKVNDWEEAITEVAQPLLTKNIIEDRYVDAMVDSVKEHGPYIVIGKHLALAHARPEDGVNELGLSVATLNPPIEFGNEDNDPVELIFCLAAVDAYSHLNIIKSLVNLLNNKNDLSEFSNSVSKKDFKNKLFKY